MNALVSTSRRPLPLLRRPDLRTSRLTFRGEDCWVVKDSVGSTYYRLDAEQHFVLTRLDGRATLDGLVDDLAAEFPRAGLKAEQVAELLRDLHRRRLVLSDRPGQGEVLADHSRRSHLREAVRNPLFVRVPIGDPSRVLTALLPAARFLTRPAVAASIVALMLTGWLLLVARADRLTAELAATETLFAWPNLTVAWIVLGAVKVAHELGHGLACRRFGGECREIGVAFLLFSPCLYCDVSDSWMIPERRRRTAVAAAGMAVELAISALAAVVWACTRPGTVHSAALDVVLVTWGATLLFNLNPLLRYDGYHLLADAVEVPNLRTRAADAFRKALAQTWLGTPHDPARRSGEEPKWLAAFGLATVAYRWLMLAAIAGAVAAFAEPAGLRPVVLGIAAAIATVAAGKGVAAFAKEVSRTKRGGLSMARPLFLTTAAAAAVAALLAVPLPSWETAPCVLEPTDVRTAYVVVPGRLEELLAKPGDVVAAGTPLARLTDPALEEDRIGLLVRLAQIKADADWKQAAGDTAAVEEIRKSAATLRARLDDLDHRRAKLTVVAPCAGTVVEAEPEDRHAERPEPLTPACVGTFLASRTPVFQVAPEKAGWRALLAVTPEVRRRLRVGARVAVRTDALPDRPFDGVVTAIAPIAAPTPNAASAPNADGTDAPSTQVTVELAAADHPALRPGLRGNARITHPATSLATRLHDAATAAVDLPL